jgi:hypothetical protein
LTATLQSRVDHAGRADVFKGMRQVLGVEARTWVNAWLFSPHASESDVVSVTTLHGGVGLRRLRPDTTVYFTYGQPQPGGTDPQAISPPKIALHDLCTNEPARIESSVVGGRVQHKLLHDRLGKDALVDMLAVSHDQRGSRRTASSDAPYRGVSMFVDVPVRRLIADLIVHESIFAARTPVLFVYNPGARGPASPNDATRDIDRVESLDQPELVATDAQFELDEVPHYASIIGRIAQTHGHDLTQYRTFRAEIAYPIVGFQYTFAFGAA